MKRQNASVFLILIFAVLMMPACEPGQIFGPTLAPTPTPSPLEAIDSIQIVCLSVEQIGFETEETYKLIEDILTRNRVRVNHEKTKCDANLSFSIKFTPWNAYYSSGSENTECYTGGAIDNTTVLTIDGYPPLEMSTYGSNNPKGGIIFACPDKEHAPYTGPLAETILRVISKIWGPRSIIPVFTIVKEYDSSSYFHMNSDSFDNAVLKTLDDLGPEASEVVPDLVLLLDNENWITQINAAKALGILGPFAADATPDLIRVLEKTYNPLWENTELRLPIVQALGEIGPSAIKAVPALIKCYHYDEPISFYITEALKSISQQDLGDNSAAWQRWWEGQQR